MRTKEKKIKGKKNKYMTQSRIRPSDFIHLNFWTLPIFLVLYNKFARQIILSIHTNKCYNHKKTILSHNNGARQLKTDKELRNFKGNWVTMPHCAIEQTAWCGNANTANTQMIGPRAKYNIFCDTKKNWRLPDLNYAGKKIPYSKSRDDNDFGRVCEIWVLQCKKAIKSYASGHIW